MGTDAGMPDIGTNVTVQDNDVVQFAGIQHPKKRAFLSAYSRVGTVASGCRAAGIDRATQWHWRKNDPQFVAMMELAYEMAGDYLEEEAIKRAYAGNTTLLIFLLKGFKPDKYLERMVIQTVLASYLKAQAVNAGNSELTKASPEQLQRLERILTEIELQPDPSLPVQPIPPAEAPPTPSA